MIESRRNNKNALYLFEPRSFVPLATVQDNKTYWYQCDQVGAPQELTDKEGQIVWAADYKVWGEVSLRKTGTDGSARYTRRRQTEPPPVLEQPFRFQGQLFDEETGLHYNRYRYYDPGVGRFVSQDPIGLWGGNNLFVYGLAPQNWTDPLGLAPCPACDPCAIAAHSKQPSPRPTGQQSHHIIQDAWAKANIPGYSRNDAPAVLLPQSPNHSTVTALQNARRDARIAAGRPKWDSSLKDEFNNAYRDLGDAGLSEKCRRKAIKKAYKYFYKD
jgi:RHS repeat-associated protein